MTGSPTRYPRHLEDDKAKEREEKERLCACHFER